MLDFRLNQRKEDTKTLGFHLY